MNSIQKAGMLMLAAMLTLVACTPAPPSPAEKGQAAPPAQPTTAAAKPANSPAAAGQPVSTPAEKAAAPAQSGTADWQALVAAASREKLSILTHASESDRLLVEAFQKAYPQIPVEHSAARPSDFSPKVISEQRNGVYIWDIIQGPLSNLTTVLAPANVWQPMPPFFVLPDAMDGSKWNGGFEMYSTEGTPEVFVSAFTVDQHVGVNREFVSVDDFNKVEDLLNPKFQGKIVVDDCTASAQGAHGLAALAKIQGIDFVKKLLTEQKPSVQENIRVSMEWLASGRYPIAIGVDQQIVNTLQQRGIGAKVEELNYEGGHLNARGLGVPKNAPNVNAAKVYLNWYLSKEGQQAFLDTTVQAEPPGTNTRRSDLPVVNPGAQIQFEKLDRYNNVLTKEGAALRKEINDLCKVL